MEIKRFLADDVREGMLSVRSLLGPEAVILSNRRVGQKIEILATNQFDADALDVSDVSKKSKVEVSDFGGAGQGSSPEPVAQDRPRAAALAVEAGSADSVAAVGDLKFQVAQGSSEPEQVLDEIASNTPVAAKVSLSDRVLGHGERVPGGTTPGTY